MLWYAYVTSETEDYKGYWFHKKQAGCVNQRGWAGWGNGKAGKSTIKICIRLRFSIAMSCLNESSHCWLGGSLLLQPCIQCSIHWLLDRSQRASLCSWQAFDIRLLALPFCPGKMAKLRCSDQGLQDKDGCRWSLQRSWLSPALPQVWNRRLGGSSYRIVFTLSQRIFVKRCHKVIFVVHAATKAASVDFSSKTIDEQGCTDSLRTLSHSSCQYNWKALIVTCCDQQVACGPSESRVPAFAVPHFYVTKSTMPVMLDQRINTETARVSTPNSKGVG